MSAENPLIAYWLSDKGNRPLFMEMINGVVEDRNYTLALSLIDQAPECFGSDSLFIKIDILLAMGEYQDASIELTKVRNKPDDRQRYNYYIAKIAFLQGQLDVALTHLEKNTVDLDSDGILLKARAQYLSGATESSAKTLSGISEIESNSQAIGLAAMVALDLGDYLKADVYCSKALQLNPIQPDALLAKASVLIYHQNPTDADIFITQFLSQLPSSGRGWSVQGQTSLLRQNFNKSLSELNTAVKLMPEHIGTWHLLAWNYYLLGLFDKAEQSFESALKLDEAFADSYGGLAVVAAIRGDVDVAQKHIKLASRLNKSSFSAEYARALLENAAGDNNAADIRIDNLLAQNTHLENVTYRELIRQVIERNANE
ncbi:tetratricopeptide repeat protein [Arsukibacterium perlucidum]|uniref:tetratricopeptide repeat protein n=1 Tax=Arsukibacterium perlucidum TaxID=368811 RepID=UPI00037B8833|nr:tetratricopeptide repeat protein [Arsukibacterium perlucidum]